MYLIRAESNFRLNTSLGATPLDAVNTIRRRELAFEGFLIHDVKRTKGNVGSLSWNSDELVFPIPLREIQVNKKLVQNPGYN